MRLLVHEAERWVGVKEQGGDNRGQIVEMFQRAVDGKAAGEPWCFQGDVEILTECGWVRFDVLNQEHGRVAQVNDSLKIEMVKPLAYIAKRFTGDMTRIKSRDLDITCTSDHRFYGKWNSSKKTMGLRPISDLTSSLSIPMCSSGEQGCDRETKLRFLAAFLSDGFLTKTSGAHGRAKTYNRIEFSVSRDRKIDRIMKFIPSPVSVCKNKKAYGKSKSPMTQIRFKIPDWFNECFSEYKILKWEFLLSLSQREAAAFLDEYTHFDGHRKKTSIDAVSLYSSKEKLFDQLTAIASLAGYCCSVTSSPSPLSGRPCWSISFSLRKMSKTIKINNISTINSDQMVYCVQVPAGKILCRTKEKVPFVSGNCLAFVQFCLRQVDSTYDAFMNTCMPRTNLPATEHCLTLWGNTPPEQHIASPSPGMLMLWQFYKDGLPTTNGHVGIVTAISGDNEIYTIEGNTSDGLGIVREGNGVYNRKRSPLGSAEMRVLGYICPWELQ